MDLASFKYSTLIVFYSALVWGGLVSCSVREIKEIEDVVTVIVSDNANSIKYSGKGAGAGAMLMSSMGPVGVAIGLAIDEGIGKDIHRSLIHDGFNVESTASTAIKSGVKIACSESGISLIDCEIGALEVLIEKLAFRAKPGDSDSVLADVSLTIRRSHFTKRIDSKLADRCIESSNTLEAVKSNGSIAAELLSICLSELVVIGLEFVADNKDIKY